MEILDENANHKQIALNIKTNLIQNIRVMHALMESRFTLGIDKKDEFKFKYLGKFFNISYKVLTSPPEYFLQVNLSHQVPFCRIGKIDVPLLFPKAIFEYCRSLWKTNRKNWVSFNGLYTKEREKVIGRWLDKFIYKDRNWGRVFPGLSFYLKNLVSQQKTIFVKDRALERKCKIIIGPSRRGRTFPVKVFDPKYYQLLSDSCFVLCPDGDFIWTYRFFEAVMCGAIPIIQNSCQLYKGFIYFDMETSLDKLKWTKEIAEHNFSQCMNMLTVPDQILNQEIVNLLNHYEETIKN